MDTITAVDVTDADGGWTKDLAVHQLEALRRLRNGCILWGAVGAGKSRTALAYYCIHESPRNIIVITTAKKRDTLEWEGEAAKFAISPYEDSTYHGVLTVDSWNNIEKYRDMRNCFFIFDEQRLVGSGTWVKTFLKIARSNRWLLLSATPGDTWLDYCPVFVANGFYKNRTAFKREHIVYSPYARYPKVDHYLAVRRLERLRDQILVHMPYMKETIRHEKTIFCEFDDVVLSSVVKSRWNLYKHRPIRDAAELWIVMRRVVNSDTSRLRALEGLLRRHPRLIVFYSFDYELEALRGLESVTTVAEYNGHKHEPIPESDSWVYLVQYTAGSEGWECTKTDAMAFHSLTYSYKMWEQSRGRIDRMNSPHQNLFYYTLRSRSFVDRAIWRSLQGKKSFQPRELTVEDRESGQKVWSKPEKTPP